MASIKMRNVHKRFAGTHVIKGVDLEVKALHIGGL